MIDCIETFIRQNSAEAHLRRRDSVAYNNGVSLNQIRRYIKSALKLSVSKHTIHRLLQPRRKKTIASQRFAGLVNARVPPKSNSKEKTYHPHFHYTCAQINIVQELGQLSPNGTMSLSCDNKNKIDVGIPAVSRRNQIRTFHMNDAAPNLPDHDFPFRNSKLTPAGYYILTQKSKRSKSVSSVRKSRYLCKRRSLSAHSFFEDEMIKGKLYISDDLGRKKNNMATLRHS